MKRSTKWIGLLMSAALAAETGGSFLAQQTVTQPVKDEVVLRAAIEKETVQGDLKGAIEQYKKLSQSKDRSVAARSLARMAECYQKLGDTESRKIYERIIREYPDQRDVVQEVLARLRPASGVLSGVISTRRVWTAPAKADFYGRMSPDGRYVPFTDWNENGDLFVHDLATDTNRRITNTASDKPGGSQEFAEEAAFSRDSRQLAYTWSLGRGRGVELRAVTLNGTGVSEPRRVVANNELEWISPFDWSPDGKFIAVHLQRKDRTAQIALVAQDGSMRVLKSVDWRGPSGLFFSPDGKYLAYDIRSNDPTGHHDIFVLSTNGSDESAAVVHPSQDIVLGWSPDGKRLLFASDRSGSTNVFTLQFNDGRPQGKPELLTGYLGNASWPGGVGNLGMTASGSLYSALFNPGGVGPDVHVARFDLANGKFLSKPAPAAQAFLGTNMYPRWSPDGKYLAYLSLRDAHVAIGIRSTETGQVREVIPSPNFSDASPGYFWSFAWAPDGDSFIVAARGDNHGTGVFRIDAQTGETSLICQARAPRTAVLSPDGKVLYYRNVDLKDGSVLILKRDLASGEEKELMRRNRVAGGVNLSPDGRFIGMMAADSLNGPMKLLLVPTAGGAPVELLSRQNLGAVNFSPDGRYIATSTVQADTKSKAVLLIPTEGGQARELMHVSDPSVIGVAMWAPDSRTVLLKISMFEQTEIWRFALDGSQARKLEINVDGFAGGPLPSPDGGHVALTTASTTASERKPVEIWVMENLLPSQAAGK